MDHEWQITRDVASHYWRERHLEERARLEQNNIALAERSLSIAQARLEAEDAAPLDVDLAASELGARRSRVQALLAERIGEIRELARLLGLPASTEFRWEGEEDLYARAMTIPSTATLEQRALDGRPDLREARRRYEVSEKALELAFAGAYPDIEIGPGFEKAGGDPARAGIFLGFPIPVFYRNEGGIAQRAAERERVAHEVESLLVRAKQEIASAASQYTTLDQAVDLYRSQVIPKLESAVERTQAAYEAGQIAVIDLVSVQQSLTRARAESLDLLSMRRAALIALETAVGVELPRAEDSGKE